MAFFIPQKLISRVNYWLSTLLTEYNFRFRRNEIRERLKRLRRMPRCLHIEGTNICNAKCTFCAYPQMERPKETMPMEEFRQFIDQYITMGGKHISLTPIVGDPFVDRFLFDRLEYLYSIEQIESFYFFTNAILMTGQVSEKLLKYGEKLSIHVSWGGFDRETYKTNMGVDRFDLVCQNIKAFIDKKRSTNSSIGFYIGVRCPLSNCTGTLWEEFCTYERDGLLGIHFTDGGYDSWAGKIKPEDLKKIGLEPLEMPYKRGACEFLFTKPVILANGKVNACASRDVEAELIVGDLKESTFSEIWTGKAIEEIIERQELGDFPDVCKRCNCYISVYNSLKSRTYKSALNWNND
ncbi:MAG: radical SAM protein [Nostoc sp. ChiQUE01a]|nr:radical SAM protein [Nostoc sp. ChiQUE01a]